MIDEENGMEEALEELAKMRDAWLIPPCKKCGRPRCSGMTSAGRYCQRFQAWFETAWKNVRKEMCSQYRDVLSR